VRCDYCVAAHTYIGKNVAGLSDKDILDSRKGTATDPKTAALLKFARTVVAKQGVVDDADVKAVRAAGNGDAEIAEVVAHVALNIFTNYFNNVAGTAIDFPKAPALTA
jgi:alkylhydroperoxidase family enzyme